MEHQIFIQNGKYHLQIPGWVKLYSDCELLNKMGVDASFKINMKKSGFATELYLDQKDIPDMWLQKFLLKTQIICFN